MKAVEEEEDEVCHAGIGYTTLAQGIIIGPDVIAIDPQEFPCIQATIDFTGSSSGVLVCSNGSIREPRKDLGEGMTELFDLYREQPWCFEQRIPSRKACLAQKALRTALEAMCIGAEAFTNYARTESF